MPSTLPLPVPTPHGWRCSRARARMGRMLAAAVTVALLVLPAAGPASAAPAPWFYWRSLVDGARVCAQTSPGAGWELDSAAFDGPGCQSRRKVLVIPVQ